jgi:hypothetical protein
MIRSEAAKARIWVVTAQFFNLDDPETRKAFTAGPTP